MSVTDRYVIREMNEKLVLSTIIQQEIISRADISKRTNLNKATVSSIVNNLITKGLISELGMGESSGGRKPIMVTFEGKAGVSLSFDLGPNYISSMLSYLNGDIVIEKTTMSVGTTYEDILTTLKELIEFYYNVMPDTTYGLIGICIGIHGIVNENQLVFSPFYSFGDFNLKDELESLYNVPVILENEANLSALGEKKYTTNSSNLISISVKYGIGAGIIINDALFTGVNGYAGEIGHLITVPNGKMCPCGNQGCLEQYASEHQILNQYREKVGKSEISFSQFKKDYEAKKPEALEVMDIFVNFMAIGINNLITSFNPEVIIINSKFASQIETIIDQIKNKLTYKINGYTQIKASILKDKSTLLGGSYVNIVKFLEI